MQKCDKLSPRSLRHRGTANCRFFSSLGRQHYEPRMCSERTRDQTDLVSCTGNAPMNPTPDSEAVHRSPMEPAFQSTSKM